MPRPKPSQETLGEIFDASWYKFEDPEAYELWFNQTYEEHLTEEDKILFNKKLQDEYETPEIQFTVTESTPLPVSIPELTEEEIDAKQIEELKLIHEPLWATALAAGTPIRDLPYAWEKIHSRAQKELEKEVFDSPAESQKKLRKIIARDFAIITKAKNDLSLEVTAEKMLAHPSYGDRPESLVDSKDLDEAWKINANTLVKDLEAIKQDPDKQVALDGIINQVQMHWNMITERQIELDLQDKAAVEKTLALNNDLQEGLEINKAAEIIASLDKETGLDKAYEIYKTKQIIKKKALDQIRTEDKPLAIEMLKGVEETLPARDAIARQWFQLKMSLVYGGLSRELQSKTRVEIAAYEKELLATQGKLAGYASVLTHLASEEVPIPVEGINEELKGLVDEKEKEELLGLIKEARAIGTGEFFEDSPDEISQTANILKSDIERILPISGLLGTQWTETGIPEIDKDYKNVRAYAGLEDVGVLGDLDRKRIKQDFRERQPHLRSEMARKRVVDALSEELSVISEQYDQAKEEDQPKIWEEMEKIRNSIEMIQEKPETDWYDYIPQVWLSKRAKRLVGETKYGASIQNLYKDLEGVISEGFTEITGVEFTEERALANLRALGVVDHSGIEEFKKSRLKTRLERDIKDEEKTIRLTGQIADKTEARFDEEKFRNMIFASKNLNELFQNKEIADIKYGELPYILKQNFHVRDQKTGEYIPEEALNNQKIGNIYKTYATLLDIDDFRDFVGFRKASQNVLLKDIEEIFLDAYLVPTFDPVTETVTYKPHGFLQTLEFGATLTTRMIMETTPGFGSSLTPFGSIVSPATYDYYMQALNIDGYTPIRDFNKTTWYSRVVAHMAHGDPGMMGSMTQLASALGHDDDAWQYQTAKWFGIAGDFGVNWEGALLKTTGSVFRQGSRISVGLRRQPWKKAPGYDEMTKTQQYLTQAKAFLTGGKDIRISLTDALIFTPSMFNPQGKINITSLADTIGPGYANQRVREATYGTITWGDAIAHNEYEFMMQEIARGVDVFEPDLTGIKPNSKKADEVRKRAEAKKVSVFNTLSEILAKPADELINEYERLLAQNNVTNKHRANSILFQAADTPDWVYEIKDLNHPYHMWYGEELKQLIKSGKINRDQASVLRNFTYKIAERLFPENPKKFYEIQYYERTTNLDVQDELYSPKSLSNHIKEELRIHPELPEGKTHTQFAWEKLSEATEPFAVTRRILKQYGGDAMAETSQGTQGNVPADKNLANRLNIDTQPKTKNEIWLLDRALKKLAQFPSPRKIGDKEVKPTIESWVSQNFPDDSVEISKTLLKEQPKDIRMGEPIFERLSPAKRTDTEIKTLHFESGQNAPTDGSFIRYVEYKKEGDKTLYVREMFGSWAKELKDETHFFEEFKYDIDQASFVDLFYRKQIAYATLNWARKNGFTRVEFVTGDEGVFRQFFNGGKNLLDENIPGYTEKIPALDASFHDALQAYEPNIESTTKNLLEVPVHPTRREYDNDKAKSIIKLQPRTPMKAATKEVVAPEDVIDPEALIIEELTEELDPFAKEINAIIDGIDELQKVIEGEDIVVPVKGFRLQEHIDGNVGTYIFGREDQPITITGDFVDNNPMVENTPYEPSVGYVIKSIDGLDLDAKSDFSVGTDEVSNILIEYKELVDSIENEPFEGLIKKVKDSKSNIKKIDEQHSKKKKSIKKEIQKLKNEKKRVEKFIKSFSADPTESKEFVAYDPLKPEGEREFSGSLTKYGVEHLPEHLDTAVKNKERELVNLEVEANTAKNREEVKIEGLEKQIEKTAGYAREKRITELRRMLYEQRYNSDLPDGYQLDTFRNSAFSDFNGVPRRTIRQLLKTLIQRHDVSSIGWDVKNPYVGKAIREELGVYGIEHRIRSARMKDGVSSHPYIEISTSTSRQISQYDDMTDYTVPSQGRLDNIYDVEIIEAIEEDKFEVRFKNWIGEEEYHNIPAAKRMSPRIEEAPIVDIAGDSKSDLEFILKDKKQEAKDSAPGGKFFKLEKKRHNLALEKLEAEDEINAEKARFQEVVSNLEKYHAQLNEEIQQVDQSLQKLTARFKPDSPFMSPWHGDIKLVKDNKNQRIIRMYVYVDDLFQVFPEGLVKIHDEFHLPIDVFVTADKILEQKQNILNVKSIGAVSPDHTSLITGHVRDAVWSKLTRMAASEGFWGIGINKTHDIVHNERYIKHETSLLRLGQRFGVSELMTDYYPRPDFLYKDAERISAIRSLAEGEPGDIKTQSQTIIEQVIPKAEEDFNKLVLKKLPDLKESDFAEKAALLQERFEARAENAKTLHANYQKVVEKIRTEISEAPLEQKIDKAQEWLDQIMEHRTNEYDIAKGTRDWLKYNSYYTAPKKDKPEGVYFTIIKNLETIINRDPIIYVDREIMNNPDFRGINQALNYNAIKVGVKNYGTSAILPISDEMRDSVRRKTPRTYVEDKPFVLDYRKDDGINHEHIIHALEEGLDYIDVESTLADYWLVFEEVPKDINLQKVFVELQKLSDEINISNNPIELIESALLAELKLDYTEDFLRTYIQHLYNEVTVERYASKLEEFGIRVEASTEYKGIRKGLPPKDIIKYFTERSTPVTRSTEIHNLAQREATGLLDVGEFTGRIRRTKSRVEFTDISARRMIDLGMNQFDKYALESKVGIRDLKDEFAERMERIQKGNLSDSDIRKYLVLDWIREKKISLSRTQIENIEYEFFSTLLNADFSLGRGSVSGDTFHLENIVALYFETIEGKSYLETNEAVSGRLAKIIEDVFETSPDWPLFKIMDFDSLRADLQKLNVSNENVKSFLQGYFNNDSDITAFETIEVGEKVGLIPTEITDELELISVPDQLTALYLSKNYADDARVIDLKGTVSSAISQHKRRPEGAKKVAAFFKDRPDKQDVKRNIDSLEKWIHPTDKLLKEELPPINSEDKERFKRAAELGIVKVNGKIQYNHIYEANPTLRNWILAQGKSLLGFLDESGIEHVLKHFESTPVAGGGRKLTPRGERDFAIAYADMVEYGTFKPSIINENIIDSKGILMDMWIKIKYAFFKEPLMGEVTTQTIDANRPRPFAYKMMGMWDSILRPQSQALKQASQKVRIGGSSIKGGKVKIQALGPIRGQTGKARAVKTAEQKSKLMFKRRELLQELGNPIFDTQPHNIDVVNDQVIYKRRGLQDGDDIGLIDLISRTSAIRIKRRIMESQEELWVAYPERLDDPLVVMTPRTVVPQSKINVFQETIDRTIQRVMGSDFDINNAFESVTLQVPGQPTTYRQSILRVTPSQAKRISQLAAHIASEPMGDYIPLDIADFKRFGERWIDERFVEEQSYYVTADEWNAIIDSMIDVWAPIGARRSRAAEAIPSTVISTIIKGLTVIISERATWAQSGISWTRKWQRDLFENVKEGEEKIDPGLMEILQKLNRSVKNIIPEMVKDAKQLQDEMKEFGFVTDVTKLDILNRMKDMLVPVVRTDNISELSVLNARIRATRNIALLQQEIDVGMTGAKEFDIVEMVDDGTLDRIENLFTINDQGIDIIEYNAIQELRAVDKDAAQANNLSEQDTLKIQTAFHTLALGIERRQYQFEIQADKIITSVLGHEITRTIEPEQLQSIRARAYTLFYEGRWAQTSGGSTRKYTVKDTIDDFPEESVRQRAYKRPETAEAEIEAERKLYQEEVKKHREYRLTQAPAGGYTVENMFAILRNQGFGTVDTPNQKLARYMDQEVFSFRQTTSETQNLLKNAEKYKKDGTLEHRIVAILNKAQDPYSTAFGGDLTSFLTEHATQGVFGPIVAKRRTDPLALFAEMIISLRAFQLQSDIAKEIFALGYGVDLIEEAKKLRDIGLNPLTEKSRFETTVTNQIAAILNQMDSETVSSTGLPLSKNSIQEASEADTLLFHAQQTAYRIINDLGMKTRGMQNSDKLEEYKFPDGTSMFLPDDVMKSIQDTMEQVVGAGKALGNVETDMFIHMFMEYDYELMTRGQGKMMMSTDPGHRAKFENALKSVINAWESVKRRKAEGANVQRKERQLKGWIYLLKEQLIRGTAAVAAGSASAALGAGIFTPFIGIAAYMTSPGVHQLILGKPQISKMEEAIKKQQADLIARIGMLEEGIPIDESIDVITAGTKEAMQIRKDVNQKHMKAVFDANRKLRKEHYLKKFADEDSKIHQVPNIAQRIEDIEKMSPEDLKRFDEQLKEVGISPPPITEVSIYDFIAGSAEAFKGQGLKVLQQVLFRALETTSAMKKMAVTVGIGVPTVAYYMSNFFGGALQMFYYQGINRHLTGMAIGAGVGATLAGGAAVIPAMAIGAGVGGILLPDMIDLPGMMDRYFGRSKSKLHAKSLQIPAIVGLLQIGGHRGKASSAVRNDQKLRNFSVPPIVTKSGKIYSIHDIARMMEKHGTGTSYMKAETSALFAEDFRDIFPSIFRDLWKVFGGAGIQKLFVDTAEGLDNFYRTAMFIELIESGESAASAAKNVRKAMFDYGDLSDFEKTILRNVFLFYSFMRKNWGLVTSTALKHPDRVLGFIRLRRDFQRDAYRTSEKELATPEYLNFRLPLPWTYKPLENVMGMPLFQGVHKGTVMVTPPVNDHDVFNLIAMMHGLTLGTTEEREKAAKAFGGTTTPAIQLFALGVLKGGQFFGPELKKQVIPAHIVKLGAGTLFNVDGSGGWIDVQIRQPSTEMKEGQTSPTQKISYAQKSINPLLGDEGFGYFTPKTNDDGYNWYLFEQLLAPCVAGNVPVLRWMLGPVTGRSAKQLESLDRSELLEIMGNWKTVSGITQLLALDLMGKKDISKLSKEEYTKWFIDGGYGGKEEAGNIFDLYLDPLGLGPGHWIAKILGFTPVYVNTSEQMSYEIVDQGVRSIEK